MGNSHAVQRALVIDIPRPGGLDALRPQVGHGVEHPVVDAAAHQPAIFAVVGGQGDVDVGVAAVEDDREDRLGQRRGHSGLRRARAGSCRRVSARADRAVLEAYLGHA